MPRMLLSRIRDSSHPFGMTTYDTVHFTPLLVFFTNNPIRLYQGDLSFIKDTAQRGVSVIKACCL